MKDKTHPADFAAICEVQLQGLKLVFCRQQLQSISKLVTDHARNTAVRIMKAFLRVDRRAVIVESKSKVPYHSIY